MIGLYQTEGCPHCGKVRKTLTELGISYVTHNPRLPAKDGGDVCNEQTREEMIAIGGDDQIPFLVDSGREASMYESDDIVEYLDQHYGYSTHAETGAAITRPSRVAGPPRARPGAPVESS